MAPLQRMNCCMFTLFRCCFLLNCLHGTVVACSPGTSSDFRKLCRMLPACSDGNRIYTKSGIEALLYKFCRDRDEMMDSLFRLVHGFQPHTCCKSLKPSSLCLQEDWPDQAAGVIRKELCISDARCRALDLHIVYPIAVNLEHTPLRAERWEDTFYYPINHLRNIAWNYAKTPHVFLLDIDFVFSSKHTLKTAMEMAGRAALHDPAQKLRVWALVLKVSSCTDVNDFGSCRATGHMHPNHPSQQSLDAATRWEGSTTPYRVEYGLFLEPYILGPRNLPRYGW